MERPMAISTRSNALAAAALFATLGAISCFSLAGCSESGSDPVTAQQGKAADPSIPTAALNNPTGGRGPNGSAAGGESGVAGNSGTNPKTPDPGGAGPQGGA